MRHLMPIVTPRLVLRPPTLGDLDSIQTAKEDAWSDLQRWMAWAFDNQRSRQAMENSIRRMMDYQSQAGIALAGFHRINGDFVVRTEVGRSSRSQSRSMSPYWILRQLSACFRLIDQPSSNADSLRYHGAGTIWGVYYNAPHRRPSQLVQSSISFPLPLGASVAATLTPRTPYSQTKLAETLGAGHSPILITFGSFLPDSSSIQAGSPRNQK